MDKFIFTFKNRNSGEIVRGDTYYTPFHAYDYYISPINGNVVEIIEDPDVRGAVTERTTPWELIDIEKEKK